MTNDGPPEDPDDLGGILAYYMKLYAEWPDLRLMFEARDAGIRDPLAAHIEGGGVLHSDTRKWIAAYLRGEAPKVRRGAKRQRIDPDKDPVNIVERLMSAEGLSQNAAIQRYIELNPDTNEETLKSRVKRERDRLRALWKA